MRRTPHEGLTHAGAGLKPAPAPFRRRAEPFSVRCPFCNSEAEIERGEFACRCGAGTENGKWTAGYL